MNKLEELERLKSKIFHKEAENLETFGLIQVMREVGGYEVLMNMPIPAIQEVEKFLEWEAKQIKKKMPKKRIK